MTGLRNFPEPSPDMLAREPWRADPRWIAARDESVSDKRADETAAERLIRGLNAEMEMFRIRVEHEAGIT